MDTVMNTARDRGRGGLDYSIREAAEAAGVSKSTIQRRLKAGDMSKNDAGRIDPSELARIYPNSVKVSREHSQGVPAGTVRDTPGTPEKAPETTILRVQLEAVQQLAEERSKTIEDLRSRLDTSEVRRAEAEEAKDAAQTTLTALLTDQRSPEAKEARSGPRWWLVLGLGLLAAGVIAWAITQLPAASA